MTTTTPETPPDGVAGEIKRTPETIASLKAGDTLYIFLRSMQQGENELAIASRRTLQAERGLVGARIPSGWVRAEYPRGSVGRSA